jgi:hypothetical protein
MLVDENGKVVGKIEGVDDYELSKPIARTFLMDQIQSLIKKYFDKAK